MPLTKKLIKETAQLCKLQNFLERVGIKKALSRRELKEVLKIIKKI